MNQLRSFLPRAFHTFPAMNFNFRQPIPSRPPQLRGGLSLLEVVLAIAILGGAMVMLSNLSQIGGRHATAAVDITKAQMYCESVISEIAVGNIPPQATDATPIEVDPEWLYSVDVQTMELEGLLSVRVSVQHIEDTSRDPVLATLTRWMIDPELNLTELAEQQEEQGI